MSRQKSRDIEAEAVGLPQEVVDRLAGLLPAEALQDALEGLEPEERDALGAALKPIVEGLGR